WVDPGIAPLLVDFEGNAVARGLAGECLERAPRGRVLTVGFVYRTELAQCVVDATELIDQNAAEPEPERDGEIALAIVLRFANRSVVGGGDVFPSPGDLGGALEVLGTAFIGRCNLESREVTLEGLGGVL